MKFNLFIFCLSPIITLTGFQVSEDFNYLNYHEQVIEAERLISEGKFSDALIRYEEVFELYDFVFIRDYKVAAQLAFYLDEKNKGFDLLRKGIGSGWILKDIKKNDVLKPFLEDPEWNALERSYSDLQSRYETKIDSDLKEKVHQMYKKDQKKAMGALFRIGNKAQEKYGSRKFAPHSEDQMFELINILNNHGYPGEKIIGNNFWMSTIISHHNSISGEYARKDTLYSFIKPELFSAIENGEMSPYEYALVDDWQKAVVSERTVPGYGFLISPKKSTLTKTDQLRKTIGLRSIELRNKLVEVERKTGMNFYLPDWTKGEINIE